MRRTGLLGLTIVLSLVLGAGVSAAEKPKRFKSEVEIAANNVGVGPPFAFRWVGDVHSRKPKCEKARSVTMSYIGPEPAFDLGTVTTDATGDWELFESGPTGDYIVTVDRKKLGKGEKKIVCKADTSPEVFYNAG